MPHKTDGQVQAGLTYKEDLSLLQEVSLKAADVLHLEMSPRAVRGVTIFLLGTAQ